jgi:hypothetical protein
VPRLPIPLSERRGCHKHGKSDGTWATHKRDGYVWRCRTCGREAWHLRKPNRIV